MTAGTLLIIQANNASNTAYFVGNPVISHFKSVYRRHTNFASEYISVLPRNSNNLSLSDKEIKFIIPRNGDLINDMYFTFELPDIYSRNNLKFQWIRRLGEYIIKDITFRVGSQQIDKHYSEYLQIWSELNHTNEQKDIYDKMIGNTTDMFDPESVTGHSAYPGTTDGTTADYPSIVGRKLYVPLRFYFNQHVGWSFPLIALQYDEVAIDITLRQINHLYTILNTDRARPTTSSHYIGNFLKTATSASTLAIVPKLEVKYIFLDNEERKNFAVQTHEYLGSQVQRVAKEGETTNNVNIDLKDINKPVRNIYFVIRRTDFENINLWSNFTNWYLKDVPIYGAGHDNTYPNVPLASDTNIQYYQTQSLLKSAELKLDVHSLTSGVPTDFTTAGQSLSGKDAQFFNLVQNYKHNKGNPSEGIYSYNFNIAENDGRQPNGVCNMSHFTRKSLRVFLAETYSENSFSFNYNIYVFALNYEIMKFMGGLMGTAYSN
jgi:hypothetical protein